MNIRFQKEKIRIVLTGGHAGSTAYALIQEIRKQHKSWDLYWLGIQKAMEGKETNTYEYNVFPKIGIKYYSIIAGRLQRRFTIWTIPSLLKIPIGFVHSFFILFKIKPSIIISFGGFASFPVVFTGWLLKIPVIIHEQTSVYGRASKLSSYFASKIALARNSSLKYFQQEKSVVLGNPVSLEISSIKPKKVINKPPVLFVVGGSRGSETINSLIKEILMELLKKYRVIHQTGEHQYNEFEEYRSKLSGNLKTNYEVHNFIYPWKMNKYFAKSDLIISRSGANIVSEVIISKRPALLIPLPVSFMDEQNLNAQYVVKMGFAQVINQEALTGEILLDNIISMINNYDRLIKNANESISPDENASKKLIQLIDEEIQK